MNTLSAAATVASAASRASSFASQTVETARTEVLKEPLGFIKIIQFLFSIITFAVAVNGGDKITLTAQCKSSSVSTSFTGSVSTDYSYPYDLSNSHWTPRNFCGSAVETLMTSSGSIVASAGFFVFTGVISFLYSLAFIIIYVFFRHRYNNMVFFPIADFILTALITFFWFVASIAWSKAVDDIKNATSSSTLVALFSTICSPGNCPINTITYGSIVISCIFGFGNVILWGGNIWFVMKETAWYKTRAQLQQQQQQQASYNSNNNKI